MNVLTKIALRYLVSKKAHNAVNIITIISTGAVVVATAALIAVMSVFNGFQDLIMSRLAQLDPEIAITATEGKAIARADSVLAAVGALPEVEVAMPVVEDHALAIFADYQMPLRIKGVPDDYTRLNGADTTTLLDGEFMLHDAVSPYAVVGVGPAMALHVRPGYLRMLRLYAPQRKGRVNINNPMGAFRTDSVFVSGVFQAGQSAYDNDLIFVPIDLARRLLDYTVEATQIELRLRPGANLKKVMAELNQRLGSSYTVADRLMQQREAYQLVNIEKWMAFLLMAFILLIATFNVISTLSLLIIEKDESIATLSALGATNRQITRVFVIEGWLIALVGATVGITIGLLLCLGQQHFGWLTVGGDASMHLAHAYPVVVRLSDIVVVFALVAVVGLLTSLLTSMFMRHRLGKKSTQH